jgi:hypothetical protein
MITLRVARKWLYSVIIHTTGERCQVWMVFAYSAHRRVNHEMPYRMYSTVAYRGRHVLPYEDAATLSSRVVRISPVSCLI